MIYLFSAYTVTWLILFAYIWSLSGKQDKLNREMETLRKLVDEKQL